MSLKSYIDPLTIVDLPISADLKGVRACLRCGLLQEEIDFFEQGCPNCPFLDFHASDQTKQLTTPHYAGILSMLHGEDSWVARFLGVDSLVAGLYGIEVYGEFPQDILEELEEQNIPYRAERPPRQDS